jgi:uncharacterized protein (TIGR02217 family)
VTVPAYPTLLGLHLPIVRVPEWDTDVQVSVSGKRTAFARRAFPRYRWALTYQFLRSDSVNLELQALQAFYATVNGRANLFTFTDPEDNAVTTQAFGTGDGSTTAFQLVRRMAGPIAGGISYVEPVFAPTAGFSVFKAAVLQTLNVDYTVNNTGLITFTAAPAAAAALTWTGSFSYYCRFDADEFEFSKMFATPLWELRQINFSSELF